MNVKFERTLEIIPTTEELAKCFSELDNTEQAHFLNLVGSYFRGFKDGDFGGMMQMEYLMAWDGILTDDAIWFIRELANRIGHNTAPTPEEPK